MFPIDETTGLAFSNSAGAITIALDRIYKERILPDGTNFTFVWRFGQCNRAKALGMAFELIRDERVDVLFAPPCMEGKKELINGHIYRHVTAGLVVGHVANFFNLPVILWGYCFASDFANTEKYPTAISAVPNYNEYFNSFSTCSH